MLDCNSKSEHVHEFAIVGFWKLDRDQMKCYHFFHIPNPVKLSNGQFEDEKIRYEVLFDGIDGHLFFLNYEDKAL